MQIKKKATARRMLRWLPCLSSRVIESFSNRLILFLRLCFFFFLHKFMAESLLPVLSMVVRRVVRKRFEQNVTENNQTPGLPKTDSRQTKKSGHEPVPQPHNDDAEHESHYGGKQNTQYSPADEPQNVGGCVKIDVCVITHDRPPIDCK